MMPDPHLRLIRLLTERAGDATMLGATATPWATATFSGMRHALRLAAPVATADRLAATLQPEAFAIPGQVMADIRVVERHPIAQGIQLTIEAITLDAPMPT